MYFKSYKNSADKISIIESTQLCDMDHNICPKKLSDSSKGEILMLLLFV